MDPAEIANSKAVLDDFLRHAGATRVSTELAASTFLKTKHLGHHVTAVNTSTVDLFGFAGAGHASCSVVAGVEHEFVTSYEAPEFRLNAEIEAGKLKDLVKFGCYTYEWSGVTHLVYQLEVPHFVRTPEKFTFVLSPRHEGELAKGHSPATDKLLLAAGHWTSQLHEEIYVFDGGAWTKNKSLYRSVHNSSWDDVILPSEVKSVLIKDVTGFFDSRELYQRFQVTWKRGIIFHGLPGNGKTISLKALMASLTVRATPIPSLYVKTFEGCSPQASEQYSIRMIFDKARKTAPCLLIFEDLDSLITDNTRSYFLNEVDGIEANDGILMIGSTNHLEKLDPAIRDRPSRFDRKYFFKLPELAERLSYAKYWRSKLASTPEVEFPESACEIVAQMTDGFSFAYLKELFVAALLVVARGGTAEDVEESARLGGGVESSKPIPVSDTSKVDTETLKASGSAQDTSISTVAESKPLDDAAEAKAMEEAKAKAEAEAKRALNASRRAALASLDLPGDLEDNEFLKVMREQALTLLREMDVDSEVKKVTVPRDVSKRRWAYK